MLLNPAAVRAAQTLRADASDDRSPWGNFWFSPLGGRSVAGMPVTPDTITTLAAVYRAVALISGHMAMLPLIVKQAGTNKRIHDHWLIQLFTRPNARQDPFLWRRFLQACLLLRGNAYCEIILDRRGIQIEQLLPIHPDRVTLQTLPDGDWRYRITQPDGTELTYTRDRIWHLRGLSLDGITGISVITAARESLGGALAAQSYGSRYFANDARPHSGWIKFDGKFKDDEAKKNFRLGIERAQSGPNRGRVMVLEHGAEYHDIAVSNADAQFLESRQFSVDEVARWFGVPPHKLASLERSTNNNIEQQAREYIDDGLLPWSCVWTSSAAFDLLLPDDPVELSLDFARLLAADSTARYTNHATGINAGFLTRNEARNDEGLQPLPGLDEPLRPLNMVEESDAEESEDESAEATDSAQKSRAAARLQAFIQADAPRIARRIAKEGPGPHTAALIAESLAVPLPVAAAFCAAGLPADVGALAAALIALAQEA